MRIKLSKSALEASGGSAAAALQAAGVPLKGVHISPSGSVTIRPRQINRSAPARGRPGGPMKAKRGRGSYSRAAAKAVPIA